MVVNDLGVALVGDTLGFKSVFLSPECGAETELGSAAVVVEIIPKLSARLTARTTT